MMNNEEKILQEKFGQGNPFRVPEGYFESLSADIMSKLPERKAKSRILTLRPIFYAAASLVTVALIGASLYFNRNVADEQQSLATATSYDASYIDDAVDYAMLDNIEIYTLLSEN
jgi:hypothetical protein